MPVYPVFFSRYNGLKKNNLFIFFLLHPKKTLCRYSLCNINRGTP